MTCIDIDDALTDFAGFSLVADNVLEEADREVGHGYLVRYGDMPGCGLIDEGSSFQQVIIHGHNAGYRLGGNANGRAFGERWRKTPDVEHAVLHGRVHIERMSPWL
ncbi:hypothetical protein GCM10007858_72940 [Bradyrhizobium liaoningense]|nr:hypothetical protein GCM10007858_72940 [Bradyrhizobium liaoningense]